MNRFFTFFTFAVFAVCSTALAQAEVKPISAIDNNDEVHNYYYNAQNQLVLEVYGTTQREYTYNDKGQKVAMKQYAWVEASKNFTLSSDESYSYDENGNLSVKTVLKNPGTAYSASWEYRYYDYVDGVATYYDEYKNGKLYYVYKQIPEYDANKKLVKCVIYYADPDDYPNPVHAEINYKDVDQTNTWEYDANGVVIKYVEGKTILTYTNAELSAAYAPKNLKVNVTDCVAQLTWDAVAGAEKYIVTYDMQREEVTDTKFSADVLIGERSFIVQTVVDGVVRNASDKVKVNVQDKGIMPITDLTVGTITETIEKTESAEAETRTFFNIPLSWTLPEGHSEVVKYYVYYNSKTYGDNCYVPVTELSTTSFTLRVDPFEVAEWDENGVPYKGIDTPVYVTVVYKTGESDKSNIVIVNPFKSLGKEDNTTIENVEAASGNHINYSVSGLRVNNAKGIVVHGGKKVMVK